MSDSSSKSSHAKGERCCIAVSFSFSKGTAKHDIFIFVDTLFFKNVLPS